MKQLLIILSIIFSFECFSQDKKVIKHTENPDIDLAIKAHDSLVEKLRYSYFTLEIGSKKIKAYTHLTEFYQSKEVFFKDSIHAKKQLKVLNNIIQDGYEPSQLPKILAKARELKQKGEKEKALEFYRRGLILSEYNEEFKKEFTKEYEALKQEMEK